MKPQEPNGAESSTNPDQKPKKWTRTTALAKLLPAIVAVLTAVGAYLESKSKAPEAITKAAHDELVLKLKALDKDFHALAKDVENAIRGISSETKSAVASSKAEANAVKALFTGYALATRGGTTSGSRRAGSAVDHLMERLEKIEDQADEVEKMKPKRPMTRSKRAFKPPRKWDAVLQKGGL